MSANGNAGAPAGRRGGHLREHGRERDEDRRVRRTTARLRGALAALVHEKAYDAIAVKEILARADVGRSAFYAHFRDKDALLESAVRATLRASAARAPGTDPTTDPIEAVLGFSGPLFAHVARALVAAGRHTTGAASLERHAAVHERLRVLLAEVVADALRRVGAGGAGAAPVPAPVPADLLAAHVADTFLRVLGWWAGGGAPGPAREADRLFRALVTPVVADAVR